MLDDRAAGDRGGRVAHQQDRQLVVLVAQRGAPVRVPGLVAGEIRDEPEGLGA